MAHSNYGQQAKTPLFTKKYTLSAACERSLAILDSQKKQQISHFFIVQQLPKDCNGEAADKVYFNCHSLLSKKQTMSGQQMCAFYFDICVMNVPSTNVKKESLPNGTGIRTQI